MAGGYEIGAVAGGGYEIEARWPEGYEIEGVTRLRRGGRGYEIGGL